MATPLPQASSVKELVSTLFLNDHGTPFVLTPTQEIIVESILKRQAPDGSRRIHLMQVTQTGKSECVAIASLLLASTYPEKVAIIAPTQSKARIIISKIIKHAFENEYTLSRLSINDGESIERLRRERSKNRLTFDVGENKIGEIFILSSEGARKNQEDIGNALMGFSANVLVCDEASLIDDVAEAKALRMVGSYAVVDRDFVIKIGNPFRRNHFLKSFRDDAYFKINMNWQKAVEEGLVPQRIINEMREKPGFSVLYENKFPQDNEIDAQGWAHLFSENEIESAMLREDEPHPGHVGEMRIGNDIARGGSNKTVWCLRSMAYAEILAVSNQNNLTEISAKTLALLKEYNVLPGNVFIDEVGVGGGAIDPLRTQNVQVTAVNVGSTAIDHKRYTNLRAEAYFALKEWLRKGGRLSYNSDWYQLCGIMYKADEKGRYKIMSKDLMRARGIDSPDHADSLSLTFIRPGDSFIASEFNRHRAWLKHFRKDKKPSDTMFRVTSY
jgi:hypothetical protein